MPSFCAKRIVIGNVPLQKQKQETAKLLTYFELLYKMHKTMQKEKFWGNNSLTQQHSFCDVPLLGGTPSKTILASNDKQKVLSTFLLCFKAKARQTEPMMQETFCCLMMAFFCLVFPQSVEHFKRMPWASPSSGIEDDNAICVIIVVAHDNKDGSHLVKQRRNLNRALYCILHRLQKMTIGCPM